MRGAGMRGARYRERGEGASNGPRGEVNVGGERVDAQLLERRRRDGDGELRACALAGELEHGVLCGPYVLC